MMHSLPSSELIDYERYSAVIDKSEWIQLDLLKCVEMTDKQVLTLLSKVEFTIRDELQLNSKLKKVCLRYERRMCQYNECVDDILNTLTSLGQPLIVQ